MNETWIVRYHSKEGHHTQRHEAGLRRLIVDAITEDGLSWAEDVDDGGDWYEEEALWMYSYERHDDTHDAFDDDGFNRWVVIFVLPPTKPLTNCMH